MGETKITLSAPFESTTLNDTFVISKSLTRTFCGMVSSTTLTLATSTLLLQAAKENRDMEKSNNKEIVINMYLDAPPCLLRFFILDLHYFCQ